MPCDETSAEIVLMVDNNERLSDYKYEKINCGKEVGIGDKYRNYSLSKVIDELAEIDFKTAMEACPTSGKEEEFLLFMEWKAVREALRAYLGKEGETDIARYKIAEIIRGEDSVTIRMIIFSPEGMPEIVPCGET